LAWEWAFKWLLGTVWAWWNSGKEGVLMAAQPSLSTLLWWSSGYEVLSNLEYHDLFLSLESPRGVIRRGGNKLFSFPEDAGMVNSVCMWKRVA
jgi:hypothetical protein